MGDINGVEPHLLASTEGSLDAYTRVMPRQPRFFIPDIPQHVIARGVDKQAVFFHQQDYGLYRKALRDSAIDSGCQIHAYVLMTNHVHLLVTPLQDRSLPLMMQAMGRNYVQRLNTRYERTGTLWEGRYRASPVQTDGYFLACQRYIELNPVRSGMVATPGEYPYSSYRNHAQGDEDSLLTSHSCYLELHAEPSERLKVYRHLFSDALNDEILTQLRESTNACTVIGNDRFKEQIATMLGRRISTGKRGRPKKIA
jgi:putative transposase